MPVDVMPFPRRPPPPTGCLAGLLSVMAFPRRSVSLSLPARRCQLLGQLQQSQLGLIGQSGTRINHAYGGL